MSSIGLILIILGFPGAFAATELSSSSESRSACEAELVQDSFFRLVNKALEDRLVTEADLTLLADSATAYNPLARLTKTNPALLKALNDQIKTMTPERWTQLRVALQALASRSSVENSARAESREETANVVQFKLIGQTASMNAQMENVEWRMDGDRPVLSVASANELNVPLDSSSAKVVAIDSQRQLFPTGDEDFVINNRWDKNRIVRVATGEVVRQLDQEYVASLGEKGSFLVSIETPWLSGKPRLVARASKGWLKRPITLDLGLHLGDASRFHRLIVGRNVAYVTTYNEKLNLHHVYRFDGSRFELLGINKERHLHRHRAVTWALDADDNLYWAYPDLPSDRHPGLIRYSATLPAEHFDIGFENGPLKIIQDEAGGAVMITLHSGALHFDWLTADGAGDRAVLGGEYIRAWETVGIFRHNGERMAVFHSPYVHEIHIVSLATGSLLVNESIPKGSWPASFSLFSAPNGQVYLAAHTGPLSIYTLIAPTGRGPQSVDGPESVHPAVNCEGALLADPFLKLIALAIERQILSREGLIELSQATQPLNPLHKLPKKDVALLRALDQQLKTMTPERWAQLRTGLAAIVSRSAGENSARAESREETAEILRLERIIDTPFQFEERAWIQQGSLAILAGSYPGERLVEDFPQHGVKIVRMSKRHLQRHLFIGPEGKAFAPDQGFTGSSLVELESGRRIRSQKPNGVAGYGAQVGLFSFSIEHWLFANGWPSGSSRLHARPQSLWKRILPSASAAVGSTDETFSPMIHKVLSGEKFIYVTVITQTAKQQNLEVFQFDGQMLRQIGSIKNYNQLGGWADPVNRGDEIFWVESLNDQILRKFDGYKNSEFKLEGSVRKILRDEKGQIVVQTLGPSGEMQIVRVGLDGIPRTHAIPSMGNFRLFGLMPYRGSSAAVVYNRDADMLHVVELESGKSVFSSKWTWSDSKMITLANGQALLAVRDSQADRGHIFSLRTMDWRSR